MYKKCQDLENDSNTATIQGTKIYAKGFLSIPKKYMKKKLSRVLAS